LTVGIPIFDHHVHMDSRSANEYELMAVSGVEAVLVPCTFTGERRNSADAYFQRFERILGLEARRAAAFGIELVAALGVGAGDLGDIDAARRAVDALPSYLRREGVCAVGELSLKSGTPEEIELFERQLVIARDEGLPAMVEVPPGGSGQETAAALERAIRKHGLRPETIEVVDVGAAKLPAFSHLGLGGYGIPVSPANNGLFAIHCKVDAAEAKRLLESYGDRRLMFNSALHLGSGDPLAIARVLLHMRCTGVSEDVLIRLAYGNAFEFFSRSGRLQLRRRAA
jgi:predicted metal-dependent TIM-barrel fold hydrolase